MKQNKWLLFVMLFALLLSACAPQVATQAAPVEESKPQKIIKVCQVVSEGGVNDKSFNQMGWEGTQKAIKELGNVEANYIVTKQSSDYEANTAACVQEGADLIITTGFRSAPAALASADANPKNLYAIIDSSGKQKPNVLGNTTAMDESCFLAGYLSAAMSKTGKVGTYVGQLFPATQLFVDGFYMGIKYYNQEKGKNVQLFGYDPAKPEDVAQIGNFQDQDAGKNLTLSFLDEGIDIILPVAGSVSIGTASALVQRGEGCMIGVDRDWYVANPEYADQILASVVKRVDVFTYTAIKQVLEGKFAGGTDLVGTLSNGGTSLAYGFGRCGKDITPELKAEIDALAAKIAKGEIATQPKK